VDLVSGWGSALMLVPLHLLLFNTWKLYYRLPPPRAERGGDLGYRASFPGAQNPTK
jgi:hypothetical protein